MKIWKRSFMLKLMTMIFVGILAVSVGMFVVADVVSKNEIRSLYIEKLKAVTLSVLEGYESTTPGDWELSGGSSLSKGGVLIDNSYIDSLHSLDGVHYTLFFGDTRVLTTVLDEYGNRMVGTKASEAVSEEVLRGGRTYEAFDVVIGGDDYFAFYRPMKNSDGSVVGMVFAGIPAKSVTSVVGGVLTSMFVGAAIVTVAMLAIGFALTKMIANAIASIERGLSMVAEGELDVQVHVPAVNKEDELGRLASSVHSMTGKLRSIVLNVQKAASNMKEESGVLDATIQATCESADQISMAIGDVAEGATAGAHDVSDGMLAMVGLSDDIDRIGNEARVLLGEVFGVSDAARGVETNVAELQGASDDTKRRIDDIVRMCNANAVAAKDIGGIVETISAIADQTNLLSLNASIEAARAGDAGRGFSVVASEIGKLASESGTASVSIRKIIEDMVGSIESTERAAKELEASSLRQVDVLSLAAESVGTISERAMSSTNAVEQISASLASVSSLKDSVVSRLEGLSAISEENSASTEEVAASTHLVVEDMGKLRGISGDMSSAADALMESMSFFK